MGRLLFTVVLVSVSAQMRPVPEACADTQRLHERDAFVACAAAAAERYRDHQIAVLEGYRLIGGDFPAMGEHWIRIGLVFDGVVDPRKPEFLSYIVVDGRRELVGLAYANPLLAGESPLNWPAGPEAWHDHFRSIDEETFQPLHHSPDGATDVARLSMLHVWAVVDNPDGVFAPDNWALSFVRLGLDAPAHPPAGAARALALASGGREYFAQVINRATDSTEVAGVNAILGATEHLVRGVIGRVDHRQRLDPDELTELAGAWQAMWEQIDAGFPPAMRMRLQHTAIR